MQPADSTWITVGYRMNEATWVKWVEWAQAELWDNSFLIFLPYVFISELRHGPCRGGIHVDSLTLHVIAGNWQKGCVLVCWWFVTRWTTQRSSSAGAMRCCGTAAVNVVIRLVPEPGGPAFSICAERFQDPAVNDKKCSYSSYLQFPVFPEIRGAKKQHFLRVLLLATACKNPPLSLFLSFLS